MKRKRKCARKIQVKGYTACGGGGFGSRRCRRVPGHLRCAPRR